MDPVDDFSFNVFPNPFDQFVNIEFNQAHSGYAELFSSDGRLVGIRSYIETEKVILDMPNIISGLYFLRVTSLGGPQQTVKVIKVN